MDKILISLLHGVLAGVRSRAVLQLEIIALRHELGVLQRNQRTRIRLSWLDRTLWVLLYCLWSGCLGAVVIVKPDTVVRSTMTIRFNAGAARQGKVPGGHDVDLRRPSIVVIY